jgi:hypothetical protein
MAIAGSEWGLVQTFRRALQGESMETCNRCQEGWFIMNFENGWHSKLVLKHRSQTSIFFLPFLMVLFTENLEFSLYLTFSVLSIALP